MSRTETVSLATANKTFALETKSEAKMGENEIKKN